MLVRKVFAGKIQNISAANAQRILRLRLKRIESFIRMIFAKTCIHGNILTRVDSGLFIFYWSPKTKVLKISILISRSSICYIAYTCSNSSPVLFGGWQRTHFSFHNLSPSMCRNVFASPIENANWENAPRWVPPRRVLLSKRRQKSLIRKVNKAWIAQWLWLWIRRLGSCRAVTHCSCRHRSDGCVRRYAGTDVKFIFVLIRCCVA